MTPVPRPPVPFDRGVLVDLYVERGLSMAQTGAELGVSTGAGWCRAGVSPAEMAGRLGCSKSTVYNTLRRFGSPEYRR